MFAPLLLMATLPRQAADPGLSAWRTPDKFGHSCASCHSPDGIELARYGFSREDLVRRAAVHLSGEQQAEVVQFILRQRSTLQIPAADPMTARPMQPGGHVLLGDSAEARDGAFVASLAQRAPLLSGKRINSLAGAKAIRNEVLALDLSQLPVGIEMNRLSEDGFHGNEHASLAHWIPDVPVVTTEAELAAEDSYLQHPTDAAYAALDQLVAESAPKSTPIQALAVAKFRSLLSLQHQLRTAAQPPQTSDNPFWQVAEVARTSEMFNGSQFGLQPDLNAAKSSGPAYPEQMRQMRLPWYWLGWIHDPALTHSGGRGETRRADYFTQTLQRDGPYPAHSVFMLLRKLCEQQRTPSTRPFEIQFSLLLLNTPLVAQEPKDAVMRVGFRRLAGNAFRTVLYLLRESLQTTGMVKLRESQMLQVRQIDAYLNAIGEPERKLVDETTKLMNAAQRAPLGG